MTLEKIVLEKLANWRPDGSRASLEVADASSGWTVCLTADCVEQVGSRLQELTLSRNVPLASVDLADRARGVAEQVTGLLEPLHVVEVDAVRQTALLRSEAPNQRGEDLFYYEILLQSDGAANLRRYQSSHQAGIRRQQVAFSLTHEALAKLLDDLTRLA